MVVIIAILFFNFFQKSESNDVKNQLIYRSIDTAIIVESSIDSIFFPMINYSFSKSTMDSICNESKKNEIFLSPYAKQLKEGQITRGKYLKITDSLFHRAAKIDFYELWFISFDTISIESENYELYLFDMSFRQSFSDSIRENVYNEHYCYKIIYLKNNFITVYSDPEKSKPEWWNYYTYNISSAPGKDTAELERLIQTSTSLLNGDSWFNREYMR